MLRDHLHLGESSPCDGCRLSRVCGQQELACRAFQAWSEEEGWSSLPRRPSRDIYREIYEPHNR